MRQYELAIRIAQIHHLVDERKYKKALAVIQTLDVRQVRSLSDLKVIAEVYTRTEQYDAAKAMYLRICRTSRTRRVLHRLVYLSIRTNSMEDAEAYYQEYMRMNPSLRDALILRYRIDKASGAPIGKLIEVLQELKQEEYIEEWAYELAKLYHRAGRRDECMEECKDIMLWFGSGEIVERAKILMDHLKERDPIPYYDDKDFTIPKKEEPNPDDTGSLPDLNEFIKERKALKRGERKAERAARKAEADYGEDYNEELQEVAAHSREKEKALKKPKGQQESYTEFIDDYEEDDFEQDMVLPHVAKGGIQKLSGLLKFGRKDEDKAGRKDTSEPKKEKAGQEEEKPERKKGKPEWEEEKLQWKKEKPEWEEEKPQWKKEKPEWEEEKPERKKEKPEWDEEKPELEKGKPEWEEDIPERKKKLPAQKKAGQEEVPDREKKEAPNLEDTKEWKKKESERNRETAGQEKEALRQKEEAQEREESVAEQETVYAKKETPKKKKVEYVPHSQSGTGITQDLAREITAIYEMEQQEQLKEKKVTVIRERAEGEKRPPKKEQAAVTKPVKNVRPAGNTKDKTNIATNLVDRMTQAIQKSASKSYIPIDIEERQRSTGKEERPEAPGKIPERPGRQEALDRAGSETGRQEVLGRAGSESQDGTGLPKDSLTIALEKEVEEYQAAKTQVEQHTEVRPESEEELLKTLLEEEIHDPVRLQEPLVDGAAGRLQDEPVEMDKADVALETEGLPEGAKESEKAERLPESAKEGMETEGLPEEPEELEETEGLPEGAEEPEKAEELPEEPEELEETGELPEGAEEPEKVERLPESAKERKETEGLPEEPKELKETEGLPEGAKEPEKAEELPEEPEELEETEELPERAREPGKAKELPEEPEELEKTGGLPEGAKERKETERLPEGSKEPEKAERLPESAKERKETEGLPEEPKELKETEGLPEEPEELEETEGLPEEPEELEKTGGLPEGAEERKETERLPEDTEKPGKAEKTDEAERVEESAEDLRQDEALAEETIEPEEITEPEEIAEPEETAEPEKPDSSDGTARQEGEAGKEEVTDGKENTKDLTEEIKAVKAASALKDYRAPEIPVVETDYAAMPQITYEDLPTTRALQQSFQDVLRLIEGELDPSHFVLMGDGTERIVGVSKKIVHVMKATNYLSKGRIAKIRASKLNKMDLISFRRELKGNCLLIEEASDLLFPTITKIFSIMEEYAGDFVVILSDEGTTLDQLFRFVPVLAKRFKYIIDITKYTKKDYE